MWRSTLKIETWRYEQLEVNDRKCPFCKTEIETELHAKEGMGSFEWEINQDFRHLFKSPYIKKR